MLEATSEGSMTSLKKADDMWARADDSRVIVAYEATKWRVRKPSNRTIFKDGQETGEKHSFEYYLSRGKVS